MGKNILNKQFILT